MAHLYSIRQIVKIPSTLLSESKPKWDLKISLQELRANNRAHSAKLRVAQKVRD